MKLFMTILTTVILFGCNKKKEQPLTLEFKAFYLKTNDNVAQCVTKEVINVYGTIIPKNTNFEAHIKDTISQGGRKRYNFIVNRINNIDCSFFGYDYYDGLKSIDYSNIELEKPITFKVH